jgi:hypothetical protein
MAYEQQCFGEPLETMPLLFIRLRLVLVQKSLVRFLYPISYQLVTASYIDYDIYSSYALEDRVCNYILALCQQQKDVCKFSIESETLKKYRMVGLASCVTYYDFGLYGSSCRCCRYKTNVDLNMATTQYILL